MNGGSAASQPPMVMAVFLATSTRRGSIKLSIRER
jgi:hypothetical protein